MVGFNKSNRLSPPLMWAFRSAHEKRDARQSPDERRVSDQERVVSGRKGGSQASITEPLLRREVWRDLGQLMNTIALESTLVEVTGLSHVRGSILNFGLPDIAHRSIDELAGSQGLERDIEAALKAFEPRLIPATIRVQRDTAADVDALQVRFIVRADMSCRPVDIPLEFTADVEIDSGKFVINRL